MKHYAIVDASGLVVNTCVWDGAPFDPGDPEADPPRPPSGWSPPEGTTAVLDETARAAPGWTYANGEFVPPA